MTKRADGTFIVESMSGAERAYRVDPQAGTCTCPHFVRRLSGTGQKCKHLQAVEITPQPTALERAAAKAAGLTDEELLRFAREKNGSPAGAACWLELARRRNLVQAENQPQVDLAAGTCTCREFMERRDGKRIGVIWITCRHLDKARQEAIKDGASVAPRPIPPGVLQLLEGASEAERERALAVYQR
jgi:hypothetical protein